MLRRFADPLLRRQIAHTEASRDHYKMLAHAFADRLKEARRDQRDADRALETQAQLVERWRLIAQGAQTELAEARAELAALNQETPK